ncbi:peptide-methionine (S)-S-oxide reductase MsrA [Akkermansiaceae bacterium]|nr:peptide-methionine (S)-S-oxide reductase MsrA [Akkermansiaceae bacterium]MDB4500852.1 peptide-methionine (S)-S-oxide reductase MsrA [Akkermansiaceae bacterium]MDB4541411.1 peptide-methionine (S)-S-oxide reductase MsrA [Akkermansiaceae bacterium]
MKTPLLITSALLSFVSSSCDSGTAEKERLSEIDKAFASEEKAAEVEATPEIMITVPAEKETITFGTGCYWCTEAIFQQLEGVESVTSGFMGGHIPNPTYEDVCSKMSGHVEVVQIVFDPSVISNRTLLKWFWKSHDPTDAGGQGADRGPQYATTIFYHSDEQKMLSEESMKIAQAAFDRPIATKIRKVKTFYEAMKEHQDFYFNNKKNGYCRAVINPKLDKLGLDK